MASSSEFLALPLEKRLFRAHHKLMTSHEFIALSGVMMTGSRFIRTKEDPGPFPVPTAATDGFHVYYGHDFCMGLDEKELNFIVLHENYHKMYKHLSVWNHLFKIDPEVAGRACDYVINAGIKKADPNERWAKMPSGGCYDPRFDGMDSGQVFRILYGEKKSGKNKSGENKNGENKSKGGSGKGEGDSGGSGGESFDEHLWQQAAQAGLDPKEAERREAAIDHAIRQGQSAHAAVVGRGAGRSNRELQAALLPPVDWRKATMDFVVEVMAGRDISTWARPSRRSVATGIYMPSTYSEAIGEVLVGIDTSGSVSSSLLGAFINHMKVMANTVNPAKLHMTYWDEEVEAYQCFEQGQYSDLDKLARPMGGGGTSPSSVTRWMKQNPLVKPVCAIMLTDGYVNDWGGNWPCPVLWVIAGNLNAEPNVGRTVQVTRE